MSWGVRQLLAGRVPLQGALAWELFHAFGIRRQGQPLPASVALSPAAIHEILETLKQAFDPSIVSVFDLPGIQAKARQEGVQEAVGELEEMIAALPEGEDEPEILSRAVRALRLLEMRNPMLSVTG